MEIKEKCACCGFLTVDGDFNICPVCYWQKDSFQERNFNDEGGPNQISLKKAIEQYRNIGAIDEVFINNVRPPLADELVE